MGVDRRPCRSPRAGPSRRPACRLGWPGSAGVGRAGGSGRPPVTGAAAAATTGTWRVASASGLRRRRPARARRPARRSGVGARGGGGLGGRLLRRLGLGLRGLRAHRAALRLQHLRRLLVDGLAVRLVEDGQALVAHGVDVLPELGVKASVSDGVKRFHSGSRVGPGQPRDTPYASGAAEPQRSRKALIASRWPGPLLLVADAQTLLRSEAEHADLALVEVVVHVERGLADLGQRVGPRQGRVDHPLRDQPVGLPGLAVVGEVGADDPLEVHPQVAVVVLVHEARGRRAGDDRAALARGVHAGTEGLAARVLEDDVDVLAAGQLADVGAETPPLPRVLGPLVLPEPVAGLGAVDDQLGAHPAADLGLLVAGDHADRDRAAVERVLRGEAAEPAAGAPDQHVVALLHAGAVAADQLAVRRAVHQPGGGGLLPGEVGGLGHQLVGLDQRDLGQAAEVGLEAPDPLLGIHHRVVVPVGALELDRQAVGDDLVARLPQVDAHARWPARRRTGRSRRRGRAGRAACSAG